MKGEVGLTTKCTETTNGVRLIEDNSPWLEHRTQVGRSGDAHPLETIGVFRRGVESIDLPGFWRRLNTEAAIDKARVHSYCANMKNITLKVDDATYMRARVRAAKEGKSVSAMVRDFLNSLEDEADSQDRQRREAMQALFAMAEAQADYSTRPVQPLTRDEIYHERLR